MRTRDEAILVKDFSHLPRTDRECHVCEEGNFRKDGHEMVCENCGYTPSHESGTKSETPWQSHRREVRLRASGELDGRPRLVGGYADAYWGDGEYSYSPGNGFSF